jgi:hypothetical protein
MFNNVNLLSTMASNFGDFARRVLKIVFTADELRSHGLPPRRDHLSRPVLDEDRFKLVNGENVSDS